MLSSEALRDPEELVKYYRDVIRLARKHAKPVSPGDPHFWLRPVILEPGSELASFGWIDTFNEVFGFLASVRAVTEGQLYRNVDQGWHVEVIGRGPDIFIREGEPQYARTFQCFRSSRDMLSRQSAAIEDQARKIKSAILDAIGSNYWDYPPRGTGGAAQGPAA